MATCQVPAGSRRRLFWATQPSACGTRQTCGYECGIPGLSYSKGSLYDCNDGAFGCPPATERPECLPDDAIGPRSILTTDWVRGLIINMLMTDGKLPDIPCGYRPGGQGGHWSSSYIEQGSPEIGTLMRTVDAVGRVQDSVSLIASFAKATLQRLVQRGVALAVEVTGVYLGSGKMRLDIIVSGRNGDEARVGIDAARTTNGWVWQ